MVVFSRQNFAHSQSILINLKSTVTRELYINYRYLYIFVWKNVGALNDDLFGMAILLSNSILTFGWAFTLIMTGVRSAIYAGII